VPLPPVAPSDAAGGAAPGANACAVFAGLTVGSARRADVERVLGPPAAVISPALVEHAPQSDTGAIFAEYAGDSDIVDRIEVHVRGAASLESVLARAGASGPPAAGVTDDMGQLSQFYGGAACLAVKFAGETAASGVTSVGYYSRTLFDLRVAGARP
jgi:hypothetical protein